MDRLIEERQRAQEQVAARAREYRATAASALPDGRDDEHDPDGSTPATDHALAFCLLAGAKAHLAAVERAWERVAAGSYGRCECCGSMIPAERLDVVPTAVTCVHCARRP